MKKIFILLLLSLCLLPFLCAAETAAPAGEEAEWTVLFYVCGADLESRYSCATEMLTEISRTTEPYNIVEESAEKNGQSAESIEIVSPGRVNVLLATGGAREWHAEGEPGLNIRTDCLQYWSYSPYIDDDYTFLEDKALPLASMSDPETLTDFIRWGVQACPAKRYALVLWGHGGGSGTGVLIDELFGGDIMNLTELRQALADGGATFEAIIFDACLMANLETAWAVRDSARWMTASEEMVSGKGTAVEDWLQQLYYVPECDGRVLGRWICDMTQIRYADNDDEQARELLTWSVVDLSKVELLAAMFDRFFESFNYVYEHYPEIAAYYSNAFLNARSYGMGKDNMHDLAGILYQPAFRITAGADMQRDFQNVLSETVDYCVRGSGRPEARGLSFCLATDYYPEELDVYALNCASPNYLAFLDAVTPCWTAPDWVYEKARRLPEMDTLPAYRIDIQKEITQNGVPALIISQDKEILISTIRYHLYRLNEGTGQVISLGTVPAWWQDAGHDDMSCYVAGRLQQWPSINEEPCEVQMLNGPENGLIYNILFNVPLRLGADTWFLRCAYMENTDSYEVYGLWNGYDATSALFNRNVRPLSQVAGQMFNLLYTVYTGRNGGSASYEFGPEMTIYKALRMENTLLPAGTYYLEYEVYDIYQRPVKLEPVKLHWDGESWTIQDGAWSGKETLDTSVYYRNRE